MGPRRLVATALGLALAIATLAPSPPAHASGTLAWPHFLKVHIEHRRADTQLLVDAAYAGVGWTTQSGLATGDYLIRVDQDGRIRSLDDKLAINRRSSNGSGLKVTIVNPGASGADTFSYDTSTQPMKPTGETHDGPAGNAVVDTQPYQPKFTLPMDFEINVGKQCYPNQYLQFSTQWANQQWRTPAGIGPGTYRARLKPDFSVVSLDGHTSFFEEPAPPEDRGIQILGVAIFHACDSAGDGLDIVGFDRNGNDGTFTHQTTWAQQPDAGYGWQRFGDLASVPRESFEAGNFIVLHRADSGDAVVRFAGADRIATAVAVSQAAFAPGGARAAVIARSDTYPDALAGAPLAAAKGGPLLLTARDALDGRVEAELSRALSPASTVYLLGGTGALSPAVESRLASLGYIVVRYAGGDRYETAVRVASDGLGDPNTVFLTTGTDFPDALSAGAAAAKAGAAVLLTNGSTMAPATAGYLDAHRGDKRFAIGGPAAAADRGATAVVGGTRFETARKVAEAFFPGATEVGVASGVNFPDALGGGADAGRRGAPLLLSPPSGLAAPVWDSAVLYGGGLALGDAVAAAVSWAIT
ncbi:MAG: hypothetical protein E6G17_13630 [Actinobacteria bacterium]|nr:MAG: hypothetical protein E6G17_13630 [Actinomycetota bacterium]